MDRRRQICSRLAVVAALIFPLAFGGCVQVAGLWYMLGGDKVKAAYPGLKEKRVAVVCRPPATLQYRNATAARDIAKYVGALLRKNVKKMTLVDPREVARWTDENDWEEYTEIGTALEADMVVAIDLENFALQDDPTLYQGKATVTLTVYDMKDNGNIVFERTMPQTLFPSNPVPAADRPEAEFRRQFIMILSDKIARHFYDHDPMVDFAIDSKALQ